MTKINLSGQVFDYLTVIEEDKTYTIEKNLSSKNTYWKCKCKCGKEISVSTTNLRSRHTKSCGCLKKNKKYEDLTNKNFGKWKVLKEDKENSKKDKYWICQCECGIIKSVSGKSLRQGRSQSCGCSNQLILTNQRFGRLIVLEKARSSGNGTIWNCICDCGNYKQVLSSYLLNGNVKSCGCLNSAGEYQIREILKQHDILFESQKTYEDCRFPDTNFLARFDFYIDNTFLLEFDGEQHYSRIKTNWNTEEKFLKTLEHDDFKNNYCKEHNIPLKRIPYWKLKTLTIEDIMGDEFLCDFS